MRQLLGAPAFFFLPVLPCFCLSSPFKFAGLGFLQLKILASLPTGMVMMRLPDFAPLAGWPLMGSLSLPKRRA